MNEKLTAFMENKMMPIMAKASANRYLNAIKGRFFIGDSFYYNRFFRVVII